MVLVMASKSSPEEVFAKLQAELEAARPLIVTAKILDALDSDFENPKIVGTAVLILGQGNQVRWTFTTGNEELSLVSDGAAMRIRVRAKELELPTPQSLREDITSLVTRCGLTGVPFLAIRYSNDEGEKADIPRLFPVRELTASEPALENDSLKFIHGHDLREYQNQLWFNPKSSWMTRRKSWEFKLGAQERTVEIYEKYQVNPPLSTEIFALRS
jgi:hypothetical protein